MKIQLSFTVESIEDALRVLKAASHAPITVGDNPLAGNFEIEGALEEPAVEKPKRVRRTNAQTAADKAAEEAAAAAEATAASQNRAEVKDVASVSYATDVRPALVDLTGLDGGIAAAQKVLADFGVSKGGDVPGDRLSDFLAAIKAAIKAVQQPASDADSVL